MTPARVKVQGEKPAATSWQSLDLQPDDLHLGPGMSDMVFRYAFGRLQLSPRMYATRPAMAAVRFCVETSRSGSSWMPSPFTDETRQAAS